MLRVHVVTAANRHLYADALDQWQGLRSRLSRSGSRRLASPSLLPSTDEEDLADGPSDTGDAVDLLGLQDERLIGGTRLVRGTAPRPTGDAFSHLASRQGVPFGPHVVAWTHLCVAPELRAEAATCRATGHMLAALMQYVIEEHATTINVVLNTHFLASLLRWDWAVRPLGLPDQHDGDWLVACQIPATPAAVTGVRVGHGLPRKAALVRRGPQRKLMPHYIEEPRHARAS